MRGDEASADGSGVDVTRMAALHCCCWGLRGAERLVWPPALHSCDAASLRHSCLSHNTGSTAECECFS